MKTSLTCCILSFCLLGVWAGWLIGRHQPNPQSATPPSQLAPSPAPITAAMVPPKPAREAPDVVGIQPSQPKPEIRQATGDFSLTNSESPVNSQDSDENRDWARNFPSEALAWLRSAPDGKQRIAVAEIVYPQLAQTNAAAAVTLAWKCLGSSTNGVAQNLLSNLAQQWAGQDFQSASAWAMSQPPGDQRDSLLQRIVFVESKTDPAGAAQLVSRQMSPGPTQNEAAMSVLHQWAQTDASAARAWAESFAPGDFRDRAINEIKNANAAASGSQPAL